MAKNPYSNDKPVYTNDVGYVTTQGVFIGDFMFKFSGNLIEQYMQMEDAEATQLKDYEDKVLKLMNQHHAYYEQFEEENEYVKKGSILWCDKGYKLSYFDILNDHGVLSENDNEPIGIVSDCKVGENIYNFETCLTPAPPGMPERKNSFLMARPDKYAKLKWDYCYQCIPILAGGWQKTTDTEKQFEIWDNEDGKYYEAIKKGDFLTCAYGGLIYVVQVPSKSKIEEKQLVTLDQLDDFNFYMGKNEDERKAGVKKLNETLDKYDINTDKRIAYFMGQVKKESRSGERTLESFSGDSPEAYFAKKYYSPTKDIGNLGNKSENDAQLYRGAGYIHLTGRYNYEQFSKYIGDSKIITEGYKVVGGKYNRDVNTIKLNDVGVIDVGKYAWEASAWFWTKGNPKGKDLNTFVDQGAWKSVSEAINEKDTATFFERNKFINEFYEIRTGKSLGLPEK